MIGFPADHQLKSQLRSGQTTPALARCRSLTLSPSIRLVELLQVHLMKKCSVPCSALLKRGNFTQFEEQARKTINQNDRPNSSHRQRALCRTKIERVWRYKQHSLSLLTGERAALLANIRNSNISCLWLAKQPNRPESHCWPRSIIGSRSRPK